MARLVFPVVLLAVLLAGCGGSTARKPPLSKRVFVREANRVCAQARTRTGRLARLRGLRPPVGDKELYAHWLRAEQDALAATKPLRKEPEKPLFDPDVAQTVAAGKVAGYARRLGATTCAERTIATIRP